MVSRVHHRSSARKRVVKVHFHGAPAEIGAELTAGTIQIGRVTSRVGHEGLATARTDRLQDAASAGLPITAGETLIAITLPAASVLSPELDDGGL